MKTKILFKLSLTKTQEAALAVAFNVVNALMFGFFISRRVVLTHLPNGYSLSTQPSYTAGSDLIVVLAELFIFAFYAFMTIKQTILLIRLTRAQHHA